MIVDQIDVERMPVLKTKYDQPVRPDRDGLIAPEVAFQLVKAKSRQIQRVDRVRAVEREQDQPDFFNMFRRKAAPVVVLEQPTQRLVPEASDHPG